VNDFTPVTETSSTAASDVFELADRIVELRAKKASLKAEVKDIDDTLEKLEEAAAEQMRNGRASKRFERAGFMFHLRTKHHVNVKVANRDKVVEWLRDNGYDSMIGESVRASAFVKEWFDEGNDELPDGLKGLIDIYSEPELVLKKDS